MARSSRGRRSNEGCATAPSAASSSMAPARSSTSPNHLHPLRRPASGARGSRPRPHRRRLRPPPPLMRRQPRHPLPTGAHGPLQPRPALQPAPQAGAFRGDQAHLVDHQWLAHRPDGARLHRRQPPAAAASLLCPPTLSTSSRSSSPSRAGDPTHPRRIPRWGWTRPRPRAGAAHLRGGGHRIGVGFGPVRLVRRSPFDHEWIDEGGGPFNRRCRPRTRLNDGTIRFVSVRFGPLAGGNCRDLDGYRGRGGCGTEGRRGHLRTGDGADDRSATDSRCCGSAG